MAVQWQCSAHCYFERGLLGAPAGPRSASALSRCYRLSLSSPPPRLVRGAPWRVNLAVGYKLFHQCRVVWSAISLTIVDVSVPLFQVSEHSDPGASALTPSAQAPQAPTPKVGSNNGWWRGAGSLMRGAGLTQSCRHAAERPRLALWFVHLNRNASTRPQFERSANWRQAIGAGLSALPRHVLGFRRSFSLVPDCCSA